jgi:AcrR family transcriptional regulator
VENTTMNDIANASDKGRRTIYTYFKNKRDIYNAVIERESEQMIASLREAYNKKQAPADKLRMLLERMFSLTTDAIGSGDLKRTFSWFESRRTDRIRRLASSKINEMIIAVADEGVADGSFNAQAASNLPQIITIALHGIYASPASLPAENDTTLTAELARHRQGVIDFIVHGVAAKG